eukprot:jgi/Mesen1/573/ME000107S10819
MCGRWEAVQAEEEAALGRGKRQRRHVSYNEAAAARLLAAAALDQVQPGEEEEEGGEKDKEKEEGEEEKRSYTPAGQAWKDKAKLRARQVERVANREKEAQRAAEEAVAKAERAREARLEAARQREAAKRAVQQAREVQQAAQYKAYLASLRQDTASPLSTTAPPGSAAAAAAANGGIGSLAGSVIRFFQMQGQGPQGQSLGQQGQQGQQQVQIQGPQGQLQLQGQSQGQLGQPQRQGPSQGSLLGQVQAQRLATFQGQANAQARGQGQPDRSQGQHEQGQGPHMQSRVQLLQVRTQSHVQAAQQGPGHHEQGRSQAPGQFGQGQQGQGQSQLTSLPGRGPVFSGTSPVPLIPSLQKGGSNRSPGLIAPPAGTQMGPPAVPTAAMLPRTAGSSSSTFAPLAVPGGTTSAHPPSATTTLAGGAAAAPTALLAQQTPRVPREERAAIDVERYRIGNVSYPHRYYTVTGFPIGPRGGGDVAVPQGATSQREVEAHMQPRILETTAPAVAPGGGAAARCRTPEHASATSCVRGEEGGGAYPPQVEPAHAGHASSALGGTGGPVGSSHGFAQTPAGAAKELPRVRTTLQPGMQRDGEARLLPGGMQRLISQAPQLPASWHATEAGTLSQPPAGGMDGPRQLDAGFSQRAIAAGARDRRGSMHAHGRPDTSAPAPASAPGPVVSFHSYLPLGSQSHPSRSDMALEAVRRRRPRQQDDEAPPAVKIEEIESRSLEQAAAQLAGGASVKQELGQEDLEHNRARREQGGGGRGHSKGAVPREPSFPHGLPVVLALPAVTLPHFRRLHVPAAAAAANPLENANASTSASASAAQAADGLQSLRGASAGTHAAPLGAAAKSLPGPPHGPGGVGGGTARPSPSVVAPPHAEPPGARGWGGHRGRASFDAPGAGAAEGATAAAASAASAPGRAPGSALLPPAPSQPRGQLARPTADVAALEDAASEARAARLARLAAMVRVLEGGEPQDLQLARSDARGLPPGQLHSLGPRGPSMQIPPSSPLPLPPHAFPGFHWPGLSAPRGPQFEADARFQQPQSQARHEGTTPGGAHALVQLGAGAAGDNAAGGGGRGGGAEGQVGQWERTPAPIAKRSAMDISSEEGEGRARSGGVGVTEAETGGAIRDVMERNGRSDPGSTAAAAAAAAAGADQTLPSFPPSTKRARLEWGGEEEERGRTTAGEVGGGGGEALTEWSEDELDALWKGVRRYGKGKWRSMLQDSALKFAPSRTPAQLHARWRLEEAKMLGGGEKGGASVEDKKKKKKKKKKATMPMAMTVQQREKGEAQLQQKQQRERREEEEEEVVGRAESGAMLGVDLTGGSTPASHMAQRQVSGELDRIAPQRDEGQLQTLQGPPGTHSKFQELPSGRPAGNMATPGMSIRLDPGRVLPRPEYGPGGVHLSAGVAPGGTDAGARHLSVGGMLVKEEPVYSSPPLPVSSASPGGHVATSSHLYSPNRNSLPHTHAHGHPHTHAHPHHPFLHQYPHSHSSPLPSPTNPAPPSHTFGELGHATVRAFKGALAAAAATAATGGAATVPASSSPHQRAYPLPPLPPSPTDSRHHPPVSSPQSQAQTHAQAQAQGQGQGQVLAQAQAQARAQLEGQAQGQGQVAVAAASAAAEGGSPLPQYYLPPLPSPTGSREDPSPAPASHAHMQGQALGHGQGQARGQVAAAPAAARPREDGLFPQGGDRRAPAAAASPNLYLQPPHQPGQCELISSRHVSAGGKTPPRDSLTRGTAAAASSADAARPGAGAAAGGGTAGAAAAGAGAVSRTGEAMARKQQRREDAEVLGAVEGAGDAAAAEEEEEQQQLVGGGKGGRTDRGGGPGFGGSFTSGAGAGGGGGSSSPAAGISGSVTGVLGGGGVNGGVASSGNDNKGSKSLLAAPPAFDMPRFTQRLMEALARKNARLAAEAQAAAAAAASAASVTSGAPGGGRSGGGSTGGHLLANLRPSPGPAARPAAWLPSPPLPLPLPPPPPAQAPPAVTVILQAMHVVGGGCRPLLSPHVHLGPLHWAPREHPKPEPKRARSKPEAAPELLQRGSAGAQLAQRSSSSPSPAPGGARRMGTSGGPHNVPPLHEGASHSRSHAAVPPLPAQQSKSSGLPSATPGASMLGPSAPRPPPGSAGQVLPPDASARSFQQRQQQQQREPQQLVPAPSGMQQQHAPLVNAPRGPKAAHLSQLEQPALQVPLRAPLAAGQAKNEVGLQGTPGKKRTAPTLSAVVKGSRQKRARRSSWENSPLTRTLEANEQLEDEDSEATSSDVGVRGDGNLSDGTDETVSDF